MTWIKMTDHQIPNYEGNLTEGREKFMSVFSTPLFPFTVFNFTITSAVTRSQPYFSNIHIQYQDVYIKYNKYYKPNFHLGMHSRFLHSTKEILKCNVKLGPKKQNNCKTMTPKHDLKTTQDYSLNWVNQMTCKASSACTIKRTLYI